MQTPPPPTCIQLHTLSFTLLGHFWHILFSLFKTFLWTHFTLFWENSVSLKHLLFEDICSNWWWHLVWNLLHILSLLPVCLRQTQCCRSPGKLFRFLLLFQIAQTCVFRTSGPSCWCRTCVLQTWYWAEVVLTFYHQTWAGFPNFTRLKIATAHWIQVTLISSADNTPPRYKIHPDWPLVIFPTQLYRHLCSDWWQDC